MYTYESTTKVIIVYNTVMIYFNGSYPVDRKEFTRIATVTASEVKVQHRKFHVPESFEEHINRMEAFWRPKSVYQKYIDFILERKKTTKKNSRYGTYQHR